MKQCAREPSLKDEKAPLTTNRYTDMEKKKQAPSKPSKGEVWDKVYQRLVPLDKAVCPISNKVP